MTESRSAGRVTLTLFHSCPPFPLDPAQDPPTNDRSLASHGRRFNGSEAAKKLPGAPTGRISGYAAYRRGARFAPWILHYPRGKPSRDEAARDRDARAQSEGRQMVGGERSRKSSRNASGTIEAEPFKTEQKTRHAGSAVTSGNSRTAAVSVRRPMTSS